jgi:hypothetical protein
MMTIDRGHGVGPELYVPYRVWDRGYALSPRVG